MTKVTLDSATARQVRANGDEIEVCDETGAVIGLYRWVSAQAARDEDWPTDEEIARIKSDPRPRLTTEQVLEHLRGLGK